LHLSHCGSVYFVKTEWLLACSWLSQMYFRLNCSQEGGDSFNWGDSDGPSALRLWAHSRGDI
jgi:hypothetical protein